MKTDYPPRTLRTRDASSCEKKEKEEEEKKKKKYV